MKELSNAPEVLSFLTLAFYSLIQLYRIHKSKLGKDQTTDSVWLENFNDKWKLDQSSMMMFVLVGCIRGDMFTANVETDNHVVITAEQD